MVSFVATLDRTEALAPRTFVLHLSGAGALAGVRPGQFAMIRGEWGRDPLLPRAFSVMATGPGGTAEILVKATGRGTTLLEGARPGARLSILGPLGTAFPVADGTETWLCAGGVGLAPLLAWAEAAAAAGHAGTTRLFYGGRSAVDLVLRERLAACGVEVLAATEDGSLGLKGYVTGAVQAALDAGRRPARLYACGPEPMMVAVARLGRAQALPTWLSLEGEMACGIGICLGCAVPCATKPFRYTCSDGPVMSLDELRGPYA